MSEWTRPAPAACFLRSKQKRQTGVRAQCAYVAGRRLAAQRDKESALFFLQAAPNGKANSSRGRSESAKASITQRQIEEQARHRRYQIKNKDAGDTGKISERNERDLGGESKRNVKPCSGNPRFGSIEKPEGAAQGGDHGDTDH